MQKILNFIGGELVEPMNGKFLENVDPSRGVGYSLVPDSKASDVEKAVQAAQKAFPAWSQTPVAERSALLLKLADLIHRDLDQLAVAESLDNGKPVHVAKSVDIPRSESNFRFFGSAILQFHGETFLSDQVALNYTESSPLGVVADRKSVV